jgi:hypothetical protein
MPEYLDAWNHKQHARARALQRYGVRLSVSEIKTLVKQIRDPRIKTFVRVVDRGRELHKVWHKGTPMYAVYSPYTQKIVTFHRKEWVMNA